ncbi:DNA repair protein RecN [Halomonas halocynthiae]|uniref:DNA repair protein RecN n=1 Tax=Halomonas halocynthiae TaxID=176290 RepID=UPI00040CB57B|nr:DNA repair protein RecN [Halomonas halocynthiae]
MLTELAIRNFAIVDHLELELDNGMTAITGETGAGKSILLGALGLCLGERADTGNVRHGCERADISARFDISTLPRAQHWLTGRDLPSDDCLLRRVITRAGRSKAWINGQPATIADLKEIGEYLIEIHGQHAHQALLHEDNHLRLLDDFAGHGEAVTAMSNTFQEWQDLKRRLKRMANDSDEVRARRQLLHYQVEELDQLALSDGESHLLEEEQEALAHAEERLREAQFAITCCDGDENQHGGALSLLQQAISHLSTLPGSNRGNLAEALGMLSDACIHVEEASRELNHFTASVELDPERLAHIESRLGEVHRIARKHHVAAEELPTLHQRLAHELAELDGGSDALETLATQASELETLWHEQAKAISKQRLSAARRLGKDVQEQLTFLAMDKARFEVALEARTRPAPEGLDRARFLISANPGQPARPLAKVASGGELSRISLAIQVVAAQHSTIPSLIFDEVDVGISGATAEIVGQLLRRLGNHGQIMTVTHLPQVAAQAHQHLHISKQADDDDTLTQMALLDEAGRVGELARMLGGMTLTDQTLAHAREMLSASQRPHH